MGNILGKLNLWDRNYFLKKAIFSIFILSNKKSRSKKYPRQSRVCPLFTVGQKYAKVWSLLKDYNNNNNLVQYRVNRCQCRISIFIRVPP